MAITWPAVFFVAGHLLALGIAQDVPPADEFMHKNWVRTFVVGNYLYMDGGQYLNRSIAGSYTQGKFEDAFSLDLSKSWTPRDVQMRRIPKNAPTTIRQAYFVDASSGTAYGWGGFIDKDPAPSQTLVGKFVADGGGGGSWSTESESESDHKGLAELRRSHGGAVASTPDSGFYFGGISEDTSSPGWNDWVSGYFRFDFRSRQRTWTNYTDSPYSPSRTRYAAAAHYVPTLGPNGVIMVMGGNEFDAGAGGGGYIDLSMETVWFLDPVTHEWYSQKTSGRPPARRRWSCTVGARSPNGTYEIFVFGGANDRVAFDDVYILSLPGFVWQQADARPQNGTARAFMSCALAGRRQMIVVGGSDQRESPRGKDPFPQGLGIFDVTDLQWKDEYDAEAAEYDSPAVIKSWYSAGNLAGVSYDPEVKALLQSAPASNDPGPSSSAEESQLSPGAIAGIVIGGVLFVGLIGAAAFFLWRRRSRRRTQGGGAPVVPDVRDRKEPRYSPMELSTEAEISELAMKQPNPELQGQDPRYYAAELDASQTLQDPRKYSAGLHPSPATIGSENESPIRSSAAR
ncbi:hypothetical protein LX32DRAFT_640423 [Colletotrichum zoysiae]|uniref:Kelch repeat protein n=1 Tax=Colletotrichum zoysiae TaxID=1216348 RepID=A0AAD9M488_9PEZI|nr:hypothetical protein LX32DRAFT_640423 [Colletotrichum zoysiae]